ALGVAEPAASGIGGQTAMLIHTAEPRRTFALDGSSRVPSRATIEYFGDRDTRLTGHRAATVPSTLAALAYALQRYGTMPLARVLEPAIQLAREGCIVTEMQAAIQRMKADHLVRGGAAPFFLHDGKKPHSPGATFRQPVLADTLECIARDGIETFYLGDMAAEIEADMLANGGFIRRDDLALIPNPIERRPVSAKFRNTRAITYGPPGAGRTLVEILNVLERFEPKHYDPDSLEGLLLLAEVFRRAQFDRRDRPYEPNFYQQVDERQMVSRQYAATVAKKLRQRLSKLRGETTHLSVMDGKGNVVALTQSIERIYGAGAACPKLGFLYNNYMAAFEYKDMAHPYYVRPNAVPWASVAPTILFRGRMPYLAIGSPGSVRIAPSIAQVLVRLEKRQSLLDAITAPRIHCSHDSLVWMETARLRNDLPAALEKRGFRVREMAPFSFYLGCVQAVLATRKTLYGAADPRRDGSAKGPP
ncbi:MAG: gamma-glutamyltransferase family protein, partial [Myxococcota bacterium]